ncbi:acetoacetate decarboxylase family protein [Microbacterium panaciterrae]|uniref:Acetoacetate decarboxylase n=1 Tax=Microbacterium panaciterrae TaxID=985759 RepID=A0ABP8PDM4_9MICO
MSYVWTAEQITRYFGYYDGLTTRNDYSYLTFETTPEFARSVLPPCFEAADRPLVTVSFMSFMEVAGGHTNRFGRDSAAMIHINARFGAHEGIYYLSVFETEEVNLETGRELWGMPKKLAAVDSFDDGQRLWGFVERKGHRLIEIEADLGAELGPQPAEPEYYFEIRGGFTANGFRLTSAEVLVFRLGAHTSRFRELTSPRVVLTGSPVDPGVGTVPLGAFVEGGNLGGQTAYEVVDVVPLDVERDDYAPFILGRLYDDWPDFRDTEGRRTTATLITP